MQASFDHDQAVSKQRAYDARNERRLLELVASLHHQLFDQLSVSYQQLLDIEAASIADETLVREL